MKLNHIKNKGIQGNTYSIWSGSTYMYGYFIDNNKDGEILFSNNFYNIAR